MGGGETSSDGAPMKKKRQVSKNRGRAGATLPVLKQKGSRTEGRDNTKTDKTPQESVSENLGVERKRGIHVECYGSRPISQTGNLEKDRPF